MGSLTFDTVTEEAPFAALRSEWDGLVRAMPRPSPFLLHAWLHEWWRHYGRGARLQVHVARRNGRLAGALPVFVRPRRALRVARFLGARHSALADLLLAETEGPQVGAGLVERVRAAGNDFADLFGLPAHSRLATAASADGLRLIPWLEAPVLELTPDWDAVYRAKTSSKKRNLHRRRRRQLAELGRLESTVARSGTELERALEEAFRLHALRRAGRPDGSGFTTPTGMRFHRAALRALAELDIARIATLRLDGRAIAFHYYFALCGRMYVHQLGFDPAFARHSPGLVNTLDALEAAAAEGLTRVEFLGGAERYKLELADRFEPLHEGLGLAGTVRGRAAATAIGAGLRARTRLKRSEAVRGFYYEGLAPARRLKARFARSQ